MLRKLKLFFKSGVVFDNIYGFNCPECSNWSDVPTAWMYRMWDEKEKKFKKYIQCETCARTTPAYENAKEATEQWDDQWEIINGTKMFPTH